MNTTLVTYQYVTLRYVPDTVTGEFLNVGVVVYSHERRYARALCRSTYRRVRQLNPGVNGPFFLRLLRQVKRRVDELASTIEGKLDFSEITRIEDLCRMTLPADDSSLQWSGVSAGRCADLDVELQSLFRRLVTYADDDHATARRSEDDVWRDFSKDLEQRNWLHHFRPKTIHLDDDEIRFEHAVKNGVWHCVQPVSFDLSSSGYIKEKAHKWLGQITSASTSSEEFKVYFLLASPDDEALRAAFSSARSILGKAPRDVRVFGESESERLLEMIQQALPPEPNPDSEFGTTA